MSLKWEDQSIPLKDLSEIDTLIKERVRLVGECESQIIELKEGIEVVNEQITLLENLKHQVKIEHYKELNKGRDIEII